MSSYACFEELEASVPLAQLRPSVAFGCCAARLPPDVDQLHGDELVQSLEVALSIHSKARVVLQCWVLLIMRRRVDATHEKDALYARLQQTFVSPQEKIRCRRGAMLLCHLLVERDVAGVDSLLDRYLVDFFFPWSSAVNVRDDAYYLQGDVVHWVRQALDHLQQNGHKVTAAGWSELSCSSASPTPSAAAPHDAPLPPSPRQDPLDSLAALTTTVTTVEHAPAHRAHRTRSVSTPLICSPTDHGARASTQRKKRRRTATSSELATLKKTIEEWAKRLRRQLLQAARVGDKAQIRQVADELQAPPLVGKAMKGAPEPCEDEADSGHESDSEGDHDSTSTDDSDDGSSSASLPPHVSECSVCEAEPKRVEQVWNVSCHHGFCGDCMLARLCQRERKCMYCRAKITQVVDASGQVYQHYDWTKRWRRQGAPAISS
jgi:hypothetical protein